MRKLALNSCLRIFLCQFKWWFYYVCSIKMSGCHPYCLNLCFLALVAKVTANVPQQNANLYKPEQRQHFGIKSQNNLKDHDKNLFFKKYIHIFYFRRPHNETQVEEEILVLGLSNCHACNHSTAWYHRQVCVSVLFVLHYYTWGLHYEAGFVVNFRVHLPGYIAMGTYTAHLTCSGGENVWDNRSSHIKAPPSDRSIFWKMAFSFVWDSVKLGVHVVRAVGWPPPLVLSSLHFSSWLQAVSNPFNCTYV